MKNYHFLLVNGIVYTATFQEMMRFADADRGVAVTEFDDDTRVSTVFLGINHQWKPDELPVLFETMVFGGTHDGFTVRYSTLPEAKIGHDCVIGCLIRGVKPVVPVFDQDATKKLFLDSFGGAYSKPKRHRHIDEIWETL